MSYHKLSYKEIIENYIEAYNSFDTVAMCQHIHPEIQFKNISDGKVTLALEGLNAFKEQANAAVHYFSKRSQRILNWQFLGHQVNIDIQYEAVLAMDLPSGLKKGDVFKLKGSSEFTFKDGEIITLTDKT